MISRISLAVIVLSMWVANAYCQAPSHGDAPALCTYSELYKKSGWKIPGLEGAKPKGERANLKNLPGVSVTMLQPSEPETFLQDVSCPYDHPGRLVVEDNSPIKVLALWSFDFGGRVFAYRLSYARETIDNGKRSELAAASTVFFYDLDGSGRFSVLKRATVGPPSIPDWAKSSADPPKQQ